MTKFYFHIRDGNVLILDPEGSELPSLRVAQDEAATSARELAVERILAGKKIGDRVLEITDDSGKVLAVMSLKSAVGI